MKVPVIATVSLSEILSVFLNEKLRRLEEEALGGLQLVNLDLANLKKCAELNPSIVILSLPEWSPEHVSSITALQRLGYNGPILMPVEDSATWMKKVTTTPGLEAVKLLERPFEDAQLVGFARRLLRAQSVMFRAHRRHPTNHTALAYLDQNRHQCVVKNISVGGACLKFDGIPSVQKGDVLSLDIHIGTSNSSYNVQGRVAWVQPSNALAGVQFLTPTNFAVSP
jgi:hypothetical protein